MENKKLTFVICLDLSAAFDTVNHSSFLEVMGSYFGITNTALKWTSSYLKIEDSQFTLMAFYQINFSVPQGSILGLAQVSSTAMSVPCWKSYLKQKRILCLDMQMTML